MSRIVIVTSLAANTFLLLKLVICHSYFTGRGAYWQTGGVDDGRWTATLCSPGTDMSSGAVNLPLRQPFGSMGAPIMRNRPIIVARRADGAKAPAQSVLRANVLH